MIENIFIIIFFLTSRVFISVYDKAFPLKEADSVLLRNLVRKESVCPFTLNVETEWDDGPKDQIVVDGGYGSAIFWREKVQAWFRDTTPDDIAFWFMDQIGMKHLITDVFTQDKVWITLFAASMISLLSQVFIFDAFVQEKEQQKKLPKDFRSVESATTEQRIRRFVAEKLITLAFVVVRPVDQHGWSENVAAPALQWSHRISDATIFAIWFIIVWSIQSITQTVNYRFELMCSACAEGERVRVPHRVLGVLFAAFYAAASMTSIAATSFRIIHPLYAGILFTEAIAILVRAVYVCFRVTQYVFDNRDVVIRAKLRALNEPVSLFAENAEERRERYRNLIKDMDQKEIDKFPSCDKIETKLYYMKRAVDIVIYSVFALQYGVLLCVGVLLNGRLLPLVFVPRVTSHIRMAVEHAWDHWHGKDLSKFTD